MTDRRPLDFASLKDKEPPETQLLSLGNAMAYARKGREFVEQMLADYRHERRQAIERGNGDIHTALHCTRRLADYELALLLLDGKLVPSSAAKEAGRFPPLGTFTAKQLMKPIDSEDE